jgi:hypothetical protein
VPDTLIQKILRGRSPGPVNVGDIAICDVDLAVLIDIQFRHGRLEDIVALHDPDKVVVVLDHAVPAPSISDAEYGKKARAFAAEHGITRFYDVGRHGIVHQVVAERGLARPGTILACTDSHTCAAGAFATAARGLGPAEVIQILCTGQTWHNVPPTIRYELDGLKHEWVNGKDIFLHIAGNYGDATGHAVEFGGPGIISLTRVRRRAEVPGRAAVQRPATARGNSKPIRARTTPPSARSTWATSARWSRCRAGSSTTRSRPGSSPGPGWTRRSSARARTGSCRTWRRRPGCCGAGRSRPAPG